MTKLSFTHLNKDWNADPNVPLPETSVQDGTLSLRFFLNWLAYKATEDEIGTLRFVGCSRWRMDSTNDHAWYAGEGRFAKEAPEWGVFYEIKGKDSSADSYNWTVITQPSPEDRHFLFYFRDETFECFSRSWTFKRELLTVDIG